MIGRKIIKKFGNTKYFLLFFLLTFATELNIPTFNDSLKIRASEIDKTIKDESNKLANEIGSQYILDSGDSILINYIGISRFNGIYTINPEGNIILPEINRFYTRNLTVKELEKKLNEVYEEFIFNPEITVSLQSYRPVNIYIRGAVKKPGLYTFETGSLKSQNIYQTNTNQNISNVVRGTGTKITRIFDAIKESNGFTSDADLTNVTVIRKNSSIEGGGKIFTEVNLLSLFLDGDQTQNLRLFDGDNILVKRGDSINKQIAELNRSNVSPEFITVYLSGNVVKSGKQEIIQGASLLQAIASAGGKRNLTGKVHFIRFQPDGNIIKRKFTLDNDAPNDSYKNPLLYDGDIINVEKSLLGKTTSILNEISNPVLSGYSLYKIFSD